MKKQIILGVTMVFALVGGLSANVLAGKGGSDCDNTGTPFAHFVADDTTGAQSHTVNFSAPYALACEGEIVDYAWDFSDGNFANGESVSHTFGAGAWTPTLSVTNSVGLSSSYSLIIDVREQNIDPLAGDDSQAYQTRYNDQESQTYSFSVDDNDSDADGDNLSYSLDVQALNGVAEVRSYGWVYYTPTVDFFGQDTFTYQVEDGYGGTDTATVTVSMQWSNSSYVNANFDTATTDENTAVTVDVLANDIDYENDALSVTIDSFYAPHGTAVLNLDNTITFTPATESISTLRTYITYTATDPYGATGSSHITLDIEPVNDAPVAVDDEIALDEDSAVSFNAISNDYDVDGYVYPAVLVSQPSNGAVTTTSSNNFVYTPDPEFNGADSFTYYATDAHGAQSNIATVNVTVNPVYDRLVVVSESYNLNEDTNVSGSVLDNDWWETSSATATITRQPSNGSVTMGLDGTFTYVPNSNYFGSDSFEYLVDDGVDSASSYVNLHIQSVNDAPTASFTYTTAKRRTVTFDSSGSIDLEGSLNYSWDFGDGSSSTSRSPVHRYKKPGSYQVMLIVTDNSGEIATFTDTVNP